MPIRDTGEARWFSPPDSPERFRAVTDPTSARKKQGPGCLNGNLTAARQALDDKAD
jgi:hypothetical protein